MWEGVVAINKHLPYAEEVISSGMCLLSSAWTSDAQNSGDRPLPQRWIQKLTALGCSSLGFGCCFVSRSLAQRQTGSWT